MCKLYQDVGVDEGHGIPRRQNRNFHIIIILGLRHGHTYCNIFVCTLHEARLVINIYLIYMQCPRNKHTSGKTMVTWNWWPETHHRRLSRLVCYMNNMLGNVNEIVFLRNYVWFQWWVNVWGNVNSSQRWTNVASTGQTDEAPTIDSNVGPQEVCYLGWSRYKGCRSCRCFHRWQ